MKANCTPNSQTPYPYPYPYLGILKEDLNSPNPMVVLFDMESSGMIVCGTRGHGLNVVDRSCIGNYYEEDFDESLFQPFDGNITLSND